MREPQTDAGKLLHFLVDGRTPDELRDALERHPDLVHWRGDQGENALCMTKNLDCLTLLLEAGADVDHLDDHGATPLQRQAVSAGLSLLQLLLDHGARMDVRSNSGWTPLHTVATFGGVITVDLLLARGADPNAKNRSGFTPLHEALRDGNIRTARRLWEETSQDVFATSGLNEADWLSAALRSEPRLTHEVDVDGRTPMHWAAKHGAVDAAERLLRAGADVSARSRSGWAPMHSAADGSPCRETRGTASLQIARLLHQHGAELAPEDRSGRTPRSLLDGRLRVKPALAAFLEGGA